MKRRINLRLLAILIAVCVLLSIGVHFLHRHRMGSLAKGFIRQADRAQEQGRIDQESDYLRRYLAYKPDAADVLTRYGMTLESRAESAAARLQSYQVLERSLRVDPAQPDIRRKVARIALEMGRDDDARDHLKILLDGDGDGDDGEITFLDGWCHEISGEDARAVAAYEKALELDPDRIETYVRLANLLRETDTPDKARQADTVMDQLVARNGKSPVALLDRASYRKRFGLEGIEEDLARARELAPDDAEVILASAIEAKDRGRLDESSGLLERGMRLHPRDGRMYQTRAEVELRAQRPGKAKEVVLSGIKAMPKRLDLPMLLTAVLIQKGDLREAHEQIDRLRSQRGLAPGRLEYIDACCDIAEQRWRNAIEKLDGVRALVEDQPDLMMQTELLLAECHGRLAGTASARPDQQRQETKAQLAAYRRVLSLDPSSVPALIGVASTLATVGQIDEALEQYRKAILTLPKVMDLRIGLARLLINRTLQQPAAERNWQETERVLDEAAQLTPPSVELLRLRAGVLAAQGQPDQARDLLRRACENQPDRVELWVALADVQRTPESVLSILNEARQRLGDQIDLRLAQAKYWSRRGGVGASKALAELERGLERFSEGDRRRLLGTLATAYTATGQLADAKRLGDQLLTQNPEDVGLRLAAFDLALRDGDEAAMDRELSNLKRLDGPEGVTWRYQRVRKLIWQVKRDARQGRIEISRLPNEGRLVEARKLLAEVAAQRPHAVDVPRAEAEISVLQGDQAGTLASLRKAIDLGDRDARIVGRAVQLLTEAQRYPEADQLIDTLRAKGPLSGDIQKIAAEVALKNQDTDRALEQAKKAVPATSKDPRDLLWLGTILGGLPGHEADAEQALRKAVDLASADPQAWIRLVEHLARTHQPVQAEAAIQDARHRLTGDQASLALARCYESLGRMDRAKEFYHAAAAAHPNDPTTLRGVAGFHLRNQQFPDAEPLLRQIVQLDPGGDEGAWARRTLAMLLASMGGAQGSREALKTLAASSDLEPGQSADLGSDADQHARALVLATRQGRHQQLEAIRILEQLDRRGRLTLDDEFVLIQLLGGVGDWSKERDRMRGLLARDPRNPKFLTYFITRLSRNGEVDAARPWLEQLEVVDPQSFSTIVARTRLLKAEGQGDQVDLLLRNYARDHDDQLFGAAALLEELDRHAAAEDLYRQYASQDDQPAKILVLIGYLSRRGRLKEALDVCERAWKTCDPENVAKSCIAALDQAPGGETQARRVEEWLNEALRKNPASSSLLSSLAGLRMVQKRYGDAVAIYKKVMNADPKNIIAMNNLAYLLSFEEGQGAEATTLINRAIDLMGPVPDLLDTRAVVYLKTDRVNQAIADLKEDIATSPAAAKYFHLAQAYQRAGDPDAATTALEKAKSLGLKVDALHPVEKVDYQRMLDQLAHN